MEKTQTKKTNQWIVTTIVAILFAVGGFFGGTKYQQSKASTFSGFGNRGAAGQLNRGSGMPNGRGNGFNTIVGQVISTENNTATVKLADGSTKIIILSGSTTISKSESGAKSDLVSGTQVAVFGLTNTDGSITAQTVQVNPQFRLNK